MTRRERMLAAIRQQPVDQLPFTTYNLHPYANTPHTREPGYAELLELVARHAGMLAKARVHLRGGSPELAALTESTAERQGRLSLSSTILHTPTRELRRVYAKPDDQPGYLIEPFLKCDADLDAYLALPVEHREPDPTPALSLVEELGERGLAYVPYGDPMYRAASLFDFEDFTIRCLTDPVPLRRLIDHLFEIELEATRRLAHALRGTPVVFYTAGPELATPPMLPPRVFEQLVVPYQTRLVEVLHEQGHLVSCHCHGRVRQVLPLIQACGFDLLEPLEPPPQGDLDLAELLAQAGRLALCGYIQDQEFHTAPPGHFSQVVESIARLVGDRTGYLMCPTCTPFQFPPTETFVRNYREWLEAAVRTGG